MADEPTVGEQLRTLGAQLSRVEHRLSELVSTEKHEFTADKIATHQALQDAKIAKIETDAEKARESQIQTRRLVWTSFVIPLGLLLLSVYLSSWSK